MIKILIANSLVTVKIFYVRWLYRTDKLAILTNAVKASG